MTFSKEDRQRVIDNDFNGDADAYRKDMNKNSAKALSWHDIQISADTLPEYARLAKTQIIFHLGYLPPEHITIGYEPFIRTYLHNHRMGSISWDAMVHECEEMVKDIRNKDFKADSEIEYDADIYKKYFRALPEWKDQARSRIVSFLGYQPHIDHSIRAELMMRSIMASDEISLTEELTPHDVKILSTIRYREILAEFGKQTADKSPLFIEDLLAAHSVGDEPLNMEKYYYPDDIL